MSFEHFPRGLFAGADRFLRSAQAGAPTEAQEQATEYTMLRKVLDGTSAAVAILDAELRYLYVNPAMAGMSGVEPSAFHGRTISEVLPGIHRSEEVLRMVLEDGSPRAMAITGTTKAHTRFKNRQWNAVYHRLEDDGRVVGLCGIAVEVSGLRQYVDDLEKAHQHLALLDTAASQVGTTLGVETTCAELARFVVPSLADRASVWSLWDPEDETGGIPPPSPGVLRLRMTAGSGWSDPVHRLGLGDHYDVPRDSPIRRCMHTGRPWVGNLAPDEVLLKILRRPASVALLRAAEVHSVLVVPLPTKGRPLGVLYLFRSGDSTPFTTEDVVVVQDLAARAALSIDNARQYTLEHTMALELQKALLSEPGHPHPDIEVASRYLPAGRSVLVGGDWFDSIALPSGRTLQVMGDVMGHGFTAAVAMSQYRSLLRTLAVSGAPVEQILREADHQGASIGVDRVATCLLALIDPADGTVTFSSAGHPPPVLLRRDGGSELVELPAGPPLGTDLGGHQAVTVPLPPGDLLLLYTDGLVEQRRIDIDDSLRRLTDLTLDVGGPLEDILDIVLGHLVHGPAEDDVTLLAARLRRP